MDDEAKITNDLPDAPTPPLDLSAEALERMNFDLGVKVVSDDLVPRPNITSGQVFGAALGSLAPILTLFGADFDPSALYVLGGLGVALIGADAYIRFGRNVARR
jgi:hypothetical protein